VGLGRKRIFHTRVVEEGKEVSEKRWGKNKKKIPEKESGKREKFPRGVDKGAAFLFLSRTYREKGGGRGGLGEGGQRGGAVRKIEPLYLLALHLYFSWRCLEVWEGGDEQRKGRKLTPPSLTATEFS